MRIYAARQPKTLEYLVGKDMWFYVGNPFGWINVINITPTNIECLKLRARSDYRSWIIGMPIEYRQDQFDWYTDIEHACSLRINDYKFHIIDMLNSPYTEFYTSEELFGLV